MSILIGLLTSVISFLVNLSVKSSINLIKLDLKRKDKKKKQKKSSKTSSVSNKKPKDRIRDRLNSTKINKEDSDSDKAKKIALKLLESLKRKLVILKLFFKALKTAFLLLFSFIITLSFTGAFAILMSFVLLLCVINVASNNGGSSYTSVVNTDSGSGYVSTPIEADVAEIINMTDAEIWMLASESRFKSYNEANNAAKNNFESEKKFWTDLLVTAEVPAWKWSDSSKTSKVDSTVTIKVNKYVVEFWKSFMSDLHAQPEKYVIEEIGGFSFRAKNNGTGTSNLSAHSFGLVLDINSQSKGMGSNAAGIGDGTPWNSDQGLSEPYRSEACAFSGNWFNLVKKYRLDWGGLWTARSLDPMHFSIVGDRNRDTRNYKPNTSGQDPK